MPKIYLIVLLALLLALSIAFSAATEGWQKTTPLEEKLALQAPAARAACTMYKHNNTPGSYFSQYQTNTGTYTYYDPAAECGSPAYPFEITAFSFTLYTFAGAVWPASVDVVVYDMAASGGMCDGPGGELCRFPVTADQATFEYPNAGTVAFPTPCCVNGPVFIGLEYRGASGTCPSILFDDATPDTCVNWQFWIDGIYYEWYNFWTLPPPGYPIFWVDGETVSANCQDPCFWKPGDPHKMHFPQLPNEAGWDVNATQPMILADDFKCMKTGPITDFHFWGGWKNDIEGQIISFVLSLHTDIPAEQNPDGYSKPGLTLWEREVTDFTVTQFDPPSMEGWYDPATGEEIWGAQAHYWQYDICFDPSDPDLFVQDSGRIYWFNISAIVVDPQTTQWGWKSTNDHWNDDAVWATWGNLNWIDIWEPAEPLANPWYITIDPTGAFLGGGGGDPYGLGWYFYPEEEWWNIWFYDHPFDSTRMKNGFIEFDAFPFDPQMPMYLEVAVNWATDLWSIEFPDQGPPLPGVPETIYIGRTTLFMSDYFGGHYGPFRYEIPDYNPEWVSVDVRGFNFDIPYGMIEHTCRGSLDLAFVITSEEPVEDSGACCYNPTGGPATACIYTTANYCGQILGGFYQGDGVQCEGDEACCMPNGDCVMADALCCANELGGTPQGPGSFCTATEACCFTDGTCLDLDPLCCVDLGGTPQGIGSQCSQYEACCLPGGICRMLAPECCDDLGGVPQGVGSTCGMMIACCFPDGTCQTVDRVCCDDLGGTPSPFGAPMCLGDLDGDGSDDACVVREDLKWRQLPDLEPTGFDVVATCPLPAGECLILADDFNCTQTGLINEIHIYGSWYHDYYPLGDPGNVTFTLSLHGDVPARVDLEYSHPSNILWMGQFVPGQFNYRPYGTDLIEGFYNPLAQYYEPVADNACWEYIFYLDEPFYQEGTEELPIVYWLDVMATSGDQDAIFGWKTSLDHWNDDAVWSVGPEPVDPLTWVEMRYPPEHPFFPMSIDLAFELYGTSAPCDCRPGDANNDGYVNVGDAVYLIAYVFKGGPPPAPYPICSGDANCDCQVNVGDAVYIIAYVFKGGPAPCDCLTWLSICGPPLRK